MSFTLKLIPVFLALIISLWRLWNDPKGKTRFCLVSISALSVGAAFVTGCVMWSTEAKTRRAEQDAANARSELQRQLNRMEGRMGSEEATARYLDAEKALIDQLTKEKAGTAVEQFFAAMPEQKRLWGESREATKAAVIKANIRYRPVCDYVTAIFEQWLKGIQQRTTEVTFTKKEGASSVVDGRGLTYPQARVARFKNGAYLQMDIYPAVVENGRVTGGFNAQLKYIRVGATNQDDVWDLRVSESDYQVANKSPARFAYIPYAGSENNPMSDRTFVGVISDSLGEVFRFVALQNTAE